jgi:hypothetical protein
MPGVREYSEPPTPVQGAQPSTKNARIPGPFRADHQAERLSLEDVLAEREECDQKHSLLSSTPEGEDVARVEI